MISRANSHALDVSEVMSSPALPLNLKEKITYKKLYKLKKFCNFEDGHNRLEIPDSIPNSEVKLPMLIIVVPDKAQNY